MNKSYIDITPFKTRGPMRSQSFTSNVEYILISRSVCQHRSLWGLKIRFLNY